MKKPRANSNRPEELTMIPDSIFDDPRITLKMGLDLPKIKETFKDLKPYGDVTVEYPNISILRAEVCDVLSKIVSECVSNKNTTSVTLIFRAWDKRIVDLVGEILLDMVMNAEVKDDIWVNGHMLVIGIREKVTAEQIEVTYDVDKEMSRALYEWRESNGIEGPVDYRSIVGVIASTLLLSENLIQETIQTRGSKRRKK